MRLCMGGMKSPANMHTAIGACKGDNDARVCSHNDFQQFCGVPNFNPFGNQATGWYSDHGTVTDGDWVIVLVSFGRDLTDASVLG